MNAAACDLLVIGLGPAGGAAAAAAAHLGMSVIAIDRRKAIGLPVQCAEFVPLPLARWTLGKGVLTQRVTGMTSMLPSGAVEQSRFNGLMVDRAAFDQALAQAATASGARILNGAVLTALDSAMSIACVKAGSGSVTIAYRALIAADGPHSTVAALLGWTTLDTVNTRQYTVPLLQPFDDTDIWLSDAYPGGYAWLFPKGDKANLGLGMDPRFDGDMKTPLDRLHSDLADAGRVGRAVLSRTGGAIPVGGLRDRLVDGNILFAGDAAGLTHPVSGAGIAPAVVSGELAADAVRALLAGDMAAPGAYADELRDQFGDALARGVARRRELDRIWGTPRARDDAAHRRGWIAFPEFFAAA